MSTSRRFLLLPRLCLGLSLTLWCTASAPALEPDFLVDSDPQVQVPEYPPKYHSAYRALWLEALARPETDYQRMAAETIARAHQFGFPGLDEAVPRLETILVDAAAHPATRFAAARALIVLNSRSSAEKLFEASKSYGADLRQLVEPALAEWDFGPLREVWIARLDDASTQRRDLVLAFRGLGQVREQSVVPRLVSVAGDRTGATDESLRLAAATAAGQIADSGLEQDAGRLSRNSQSDRFVSQLCAVRLLARQDGEQARQLLIELAAHREPAVAAAALHRLNEIDSTLVVPLAETNMRSADPNVRHEGAIAYLRLPTPERIAPVAALLADSHPAVRSDIGNQLLQLAAKPELDAPIREAAVQVLAGDRWQGHEQAGLLLGALEHKPAAARFVELLESPRAEANVAAAWALRKLAIPETVPAMIDRATRQTERRRNGEPAGLDEQVGHLCEALGILNATDAEPLLRVYIPKTFYVGVRSRTAAVFALGRLKTGQRDPDLEHQLGGRITDFDDRFPELPPVKVAASVALVRMQAVDEAPTLRGVIPNVPQPLRLAVVLRWALKELTGEETPPPNPLPTPQGHWFLEPLP